MCTYEAHALKEVRLYPIDIGFGRPIPQRGRPVLAQGQVAHDILTWLQDVSRPLAPGLLSMGRWVSSDRRRT